MSSGHASDAGEVGEGEGPKVVQSSFKEASIMNKSESAQVQNAEEKKQENPGNETEKKPKGSKATSKSNKRFVDNFNFYTPKMNGIPILNKDTVNPNTFDLNFLLNPEVQKVAQSGHRLTQSSTVSSGKIPTSPKNYIKKNILNSKLLPSSKSNKELPTEIPEAIPVKKLNCNIEERFYKKAKQTEEKIKSLKEAKDQIEVKGCTFKPQIKAKRENKTYEEFYEYMKRYDEKKQSKIKSMKEEDEKSKEKSMDFSHQPKLCEKSMQMIARKSDIEESTFARLHKLYKSQGKLTSSVRESIVSETKTEDPVSFHPTVNKRSQLMSRTEPVEKILYDDALRRINKDKNPQPAQSTKFITSKSEKVLTDKLKRDFEEAFVCIDTDTSGELSYTKMIELFKAMHLIKDENKREEERLLLLESWKILTEGEGSCKKISLLIFLIAVMGFYEDWMGGNDSSRLILTAYEANRIHLRYDLLYSNRVSVVNKSTINKSYKTNYDYSFHPQTVTESESLAKNWRAQHRSGGKIEDMLIAEKQKTEKKLAEQRAILNEQVLDECSFQPIIEQMPEEFRVYGSIDKEDLTAEYFKLINEPKFQNVHKGIVLHDLAKVAKERKETLINEVKKQKEDLELENCTFMPKLEERIFPSDYVQVEVKPKVVAEKKKTVGKKVEIKSPQNKFDSEVKPKALNDSKSLAIGAEVKEKWPKLESNDGIKAVYGVLVGGKSHRLEFDIVKDDPAFTVLQFSKVHGLKKEEEYRLVKELTLLKTAI